MYSDDLYLRLLTGYVGLDFWFYGIILAQTTP